MIREVNRVRTNSVKQCYLRRVAPTKYVRITMSFSVLFSYIPIFFRVSRVAIGLQKLNTQLTYISAIVRKHRIHWSRKLLCLFQYAHFYLCAPIRNLWTKKNMPELFISFLVSIHKDSSMPLVLFHILWGTLKLRNEYECESLPSCPIATTRRANTEFTV